MQARQDNPFGILMYHRVAPRISGVAKPTWNVTPERFRRQLEGLLARGYQPWPLRRALAHRQAGKPVPARMFVVTFDDGYENFYDYAWPILEELSVPATVFVVTSYLNTTCPFTSDDWVAAGSVDAPATAWKSLSTAQCAEMMEHGLVEVASHTHTHDDYIGRPEEFRDDMACSLRVLREKFGITQPSFAFPFGSYDSGLIAAARDAGVACALTTDPKRVSARADPYSWGRFMVRESDSPTMLTLKLDGWCTGLLYTCWVLRRSWRKSQAKFDRQYARIKQASTWSKTECP